MPRTTDRLDPVKPPSDRQKEWARDFIVTYLPVLTNSQFRRAREALERLLVCENEIAAKEKKGDDNAENV